MQALYDFLALNVSTVQFSIRGLIKSILLGCLDAQMLIILSKSRNISGLIHTNDKALRRSSPITLQKSALRCCKAEFAFLLSGFSFTNIYNSQEIKEIGRLSFYILSVTSTHFTDIRTFVELLLQRAHLFPKLAADLELGKIGFLMQY